LLPLTAALHSPRDRGDSADGLEQLDSFGESVSEADVRANAKWMAEHLKNSGWRYVVVDMGWYVTSHSAGSNAETAQFQPG